MDQYYLIWSIVFCFVASNMFWGYQCHRLINKLMSRSYFDVKLADGQTKVQNKVKKADEEQGFLDDPALGSITEVLQ